MDAAETTRTEFPFLVMSSPSSLLPGAQANNLGVILTPLLCLSDP